MSVQTNPIQCLQCGALNDGHTQLEDPDDTPEGGDLSICLYCGHVAVYTVTDGVFGYRPPTAEEQESIETDASVQRAIEYRRKVMG